MFFRTILRVGGQHILINTQHVENVYDDRGLATFVMLPSAKDTQRAFETLCPFQEAVDKLSKTEG